MKDVNLERRLSPLNVWAMALGSIIGWGAFVMPANTFLPKAGPFGSSIAILVGGLIMIIIAISYHYMINLFPVAGGEFTFTDKAFGKIPGFVCAWFLGLSYLAIVPLNATALALIGRNLFPRVTQWGYLYTVSGYDIYAGEVILAVVALVLFAFLSIRGISVAGKLQTFLALTLTGTVAILGFVAVISNKASFSSMLPLFKETSTGSISIGGILAVVAVAPWAFVGFDSIPQASEEFNFSPKKSRMLMILSIIFGAALYITLNFVTASVVPDGYSSWTTYIADATSGNLAPELGLIGLPTFNAAKILLGSSGLVLLGISVSCAILSGIIGFYMATSRLLYSLARSNVLPNWFGKLDEKHHTPKNAILFILLISLVCPFFGRTVLNWVVDMSSIGAAIGYGFTCAASYVIAKKNSDSSFLFKLNAILGTLLSLCFVGLLIIPNDWAYLGRESRIALLFWIVIGIIFYLFSQKKSTNTK